MAIASFLKRALTLGFALASATTAVPTASSPGSNLRQITTFGERAAWHPNGTTIAFISTAYGQPMLLDLESGNLSLATGDSTVRYMRIQYLPNGDMVMIGSRTYVDASTTRATSEELWIIKQGETAPIALNQRLFEGVAISRVSNMISFGNYAGTNSSIPYGESIISVATVEYDDDGTPYLANQRPVVTAWSPECLLEPQDFRYNDTELLYSCYNPTADPEYAAVYGVNLMTNETTVYRYVPGEYNEAEGVTPDGNYMFVESGRDQTDPNSPEQLDLWRLRLEPNSTDFVRVTRFGDTPGIKANNPVVSPDGKTLAFQKGISGAAAGNGDGLFLLDLNE